MALHRNAREPRRAQAAAALSAFVLAVVVAALTVLPAGAAEGELRGTLTPPANIRKVLLLDRDLPQVEVQKEVKLREVPVDFDAKTGTFFARGLDPKKTYDLYVELADGTKLEGVDLTPHVADSSPFPEAGREAVEKHFYGMKQFYNETRILTLVGNGQSAAALVELCRTGAFNSGGGDAIWRVERWNYFYAYGAWQPVQPHGTRVLRRFRMPTAEYLKVRWYFVPAWGGLKVGGEPLALALPDLSQTPGRYPGVGKGGPQGPAEPAAKKKHEESVGSHQDPDLLPPNE